MSLYLRILLLIVPILTLIVVLSKIRRSQMKIEDAVFWIVMAFFLVVLGLFPGIVIWGAKLIGIESPANLVFLIIIFILITKMFQLSLKVSQTETQLEKLVQKYAIEHVEKERQDKE